MKDNRTDIFKRRLYTFVLRLVKFVENLKRSQTSKIVGDQLLRSGTSILGNYIEGQSASSRKDYTNYFNHSLKSSNESKVWVSILRDTGNGDRKEAEWLLSELTEISGIFASSVLTLKGKKKNF
ncbi:MAG: four helix bundle protein [Candidatus Curtissbacteria bacterium]|nr:four helix bundle protein [Candidatus Curtissbacteria bacterium]